MTTREIIVNARAEALFASTQPTGARLERQEINEAVRVAVRGNGGVHGCATLMAYSYGEWPEVAAVRMRWARDAVLGSYGR